MAHLRRTSSALMAAAILSSLGQLMLTAPVRAASGVTGGATLDRYGGLHPFGGLALNRTGAPYWNGIDIARAVSLREDGSGGWILDPRLRERGSDQDAGLLEWVGHRARLRRDLARCERPPRRTPGLPARRLWRAVALGWRPSLERALRRTRCGARPGHPLLGQRHAGRWLEHGLARPRDRVWGRRAIAAERPAAGTNFSTAAWKCERRLCRGPLGPRHDLRHGGLAVLERLLRLGFDGHHPRYRAARREQSLGDGAARQRRGASRLPGMAEAAWGRPPRRLGRPAPVRRDGARSAGHPALAELGRGASARRPKRWYRRLDPGRLGWDPRVRSGATDHLARLLAELVHRPGDGDDVSRQRRPARRAAGLPDGRLGRPASVGWGAGAYRLSVHAKSGSRARSRAPLRLQRRPGRRLGDGPNRQGYRLRCRPIPGHPGRAGESGDAAAARHRGWRLRARQVGIDYHLRLDLPLLVGLRRLGRVGHSP